MKHIISWRYVEFAIPFFMTLGENNLPLDIQPLNKRYEMPL